MSDWSEEEMEDAVNSYIKQHTGSRVLVKCYGGAYHGSEFSLRKPLRHIQEFVGPPKETSPGFFTADCEVLTYYRRLVGDQIYYVYEGSLVDFAERFAN